MSQSRFAIVPVEAITDDALTATQLRVLLVIGSYLSRDNSAFPKQKTIADALGIARETVNRAVKVLVERKYIAVTHRTRDDGGQRENLYHVLLDPCDAGITPPVTSEDHTPCDPTASHLRPPHNTTSNSNELDLGDTPPEQPKRKAAPRGAARRCQIPDNWAPNTVSYAYGSKRGLTPEEMNHEADQFRNDAVAKQKRFIDWQAAFRTWLGNSAKWKAERAARSHHRPNTAGQPRSGGLVAAGLRDIGQSRAHGEPVSEGRGMGAGYVIDREAS